MEAAIISALSILSFSMLIFIIIREKEARKHTESFCKVYDKVLELKDDKAKLEKSVSELTWKNVENIESFSRERNHLDGEIAGLKKRIHRIMNENGGLKELLQKCITIFPMVMEFHKTFGQPILDNPAIPGEDRTKLRIELLTEELQELRDAVNNNDLVAVADALADLQYVLTGTVLEFGMHKVFGQIFTEVHRSNMSKACQNREEAKKTIDHYKFILGIKTSYTIVKMNAESEELYVIKRSSDGKVLRSINYSPADIKSIIETAGTGEAEQ